MWRVKPKVLPAAAQACEMRVLVPPAETADKPRILTEEVEGLLLAVVMMTAATGALEGTKLVTVPAYDTARAPEHWRLLRRRRG